MPPCCRSSYVVEALAAFAIWCAWPLQAHAQDSSHPESQSGASSQSEEPAGILPVPDYSGDWLHRLYLTGDWGGTRQEWADHGFTIDIDWVQVAQGVTSGGLNTGWEYMGGLDYVLNLDLMRMGILEGALITMRAQSRYGDSINTQTGLLLPANTEAFNPITSPADEDILVTITELNYVQFVSKELGFLIGKIQTFDGDPNEFASGRGQTQFMNLQFLFSSAAALFIPYSTLAVGAVWLPSPNVMVSTTLMNTKDSSTTSGFEDIGDGATWATEVDTQYRLGEQPGGMNLGFDYAFDGDFAQLGGLYIDPGVGAGIATSDDSWALYWSAWQYLWTAEPAQADRPLNTADGLPDLQGFGLFARMGIGDSTTNPVAWNGSIGLGGRGAIPSREDDTYGVGYFYNDIQDPDTLLFNALESSTSGFEAFYNIALARSIALTLDFQWLSSAFSNIDDSVLLGVRLDIMF